MLARMALFFDDRNNATHFAGWIEQSETHQFGAMTRINGGFRFALPTLRQNGISRPLASYLHAGMTK
jgi:hypothetical protein